MTHAKATEILRTKYPDAEIYRASNKNGLCRTGKIAVIFQPQGKVYSYAAQNYAELLERLGCMDRQSSEEREAVDLEYFA